MENCVLDHLPLVEALSHVVKVNAVLDIVLQLFDEFDVDVRLEESRADLLEHRLEDILVDDSRVVQRVQGACDAPSQVG